MMYKFVYTSSEGEKHVAGPFQGRALAVKAREDFIGANNCSHDDLGLDTTFSTDDNWISGTGESWAIRRHRGRR